MKTRNAIKIRNTVSFHSNNFAALAPSILFFSASQQNVTSQEEAIFHVGNRFPKNREWNLKTSETNLIDVYLIEKKKKIKKVTGISLAEEIQIAEFSLA